MPDTRRLALLSLAVGLFSLRATLTNPPSGQLQSGCPSPDNPVTWNPDLTLDFYQDCGLVYAEHAGYIFLLLTGCGAVLTLYGTVVLIRIRVGRGTVS
jgi:hypothetical protein